MDELRQKSIVVLLAALAVAQPGSGARAAESAAGAPAADTSATLQRATQALVDALAPGERAV